MTLGGGVSMQSLLWRSWDKLPRLGDQSTLPLCRNWGHFLEALVSRLGNAFSLSFQIFQAPVIPRMFSRFPPAPLMISQFTCALGMIECGWTNKERAIQEEGSAWTKALSSSTSPTAAWGLTEVVILHSLHNSSYLEAVFLISFLPLLLCLGMTHIQTP